MSRVYIPKPEARPLFRREVRGSGGLTLVALLFLAFLALPAVAGAVLAVVEFAAFSEPDGTARVALDAPETGR